MKQKNIKIGDVVVPVIEDEGKVWFPTSYITTKILLRSGKNSIFTKKKREEYANHMRKYTIEYGESNVQESNCIDVRGLMDILSKSNVGRLTEDQRMSQNKLHEYLQIKLLPEDKLDSNVYKDEWLDECDDYTKEIIINEIREHSGVKVRRCTKCYNHYPLTNRFFAIDDRAEKGFTMICRVCFGSIKEFTHQDNYKNNLRKNSTELFNAINEDSIEKIYDAFLRRQIKRLPDCYKNKESYLRIIKYLHDKGTIKKSNLTATVLINTFRLNGFGSYLTIDEVYQFLYGEEFYLHSWEYPKYCFKNIELTYDLANRIINEYLRIHNIKINDIFNFDYYEIIRKCNITKIANDINYFAVQFNDFKYPAYKYKFHIVNYYKDDNNVLFDLKYLIEEDLKIPTEKIPLYLTKNNIQKHCRPLYNFIVAKKNKSVFEWVNILYPDRFIEADFEINPYRNEFDSDTEMYIHEILEEEFPKKVIYNQRNNGEIRLKGKIPDWFIFTENGVWVVEYFGMLDNGNPENSRIRDYRAKYEDKLNLYSELNGYKFLYLYREDITDDFKGCREKTRKVKENVDISMV